MLLPLSCVVLGDPPPSRCRNRWLLIIMQRIGRVLVVGWKAGLCYRRRQVRLAGTRLVLR